MNVRCDECGSVFRVDPAKVPAGGVRARCSVCGGVMRVEASTGAGSAPNAADATPAFAGAAAAPTNAEVAAPASPAAPVSVPVASPPASQPAFSSEGPASAPTDMRERRDAADVPSEQPTVAASGAAPEPSGAPAGGAAAADPAVAPIWPSPDDVPAVRHTPAADRSAIGGTARPTPPIGQPSPTPPVGPRITPRVGPTVSPGGSGPRRPINPYLNADPQQKARRLARALVSDIVAYHPQKREEGLRTGALKQLFREEIKKSYEEYVEQVGKELADSTSHFQDALNDVLAGGRRIF